MDHKLLLAGYRTFPAAPLAVTQSISGGKWRINHYMDMSQNSINTL